VAEQPIEMVERKGVGHPDTICDGIMDRISVGLSRAYLKRFGAVLHHNTDKGLLVAGRVERRLGGGTVLEPMRLVIGDRAAEGMGAERLDVPSVAIEAAKGWLKDYLPRVDPEAHMRYQVELRPGSEALVGLFESERQGEDRVIGANDTSAAVGYAPLTDTERTVLATERYLNGTDFKNRFPAAGEDVKVMGVRLKNRLELTVAMPFVDRYIAREADYFQLRREVLQDLVARLEMNRGGLASVGATLNALDREGAGMAGMYLSVTGTSAEDADSGQVGRGNHVNGLITFQRPQSSEAAAGKNPVSHVGKIYNVLAHRLAGEIYERVPGLRDVTVWMVSRIGRPVDRPQATAVRVYVKPGVRLQDVQGAIQERVERALADLPSFARELAQGRYSVW
jgi:S-adenosylmethionine synthetase